MASNAVGFPPLRRTFGLLFREVVVYGLAYIRAVGSLTCSMGVNVPFAGRRMGLGAYCSGYYPASSIFPGLVLTPGPKRRHRQFTGFAAHFTTLFLNHRPQSHSRKARTTAHHFPPNRYHRATQNRYIKYSRSDASGNAFFEYYC